MYFHGLSNGVGNLEITEQALAGLAMMIDLA